MLDMVSENKGMENFPPRPRKGRDFRDLPINAASTLPQALSLFLVTFEPHLQPGHVRHLSLQLCDIIPADALKARVW